jgi:hypothetical protein
MADKKYRVWVTKVDIGSIGRRSVPRVGTKVETSFALWAEDAKYYDVIVIGRVLY